MKKNNVIKFRSISEDVPSFIDPPVPASTMVPGWWKNLSPLTDSEMLRNSPLGERAAAKKCFPMLDSLTSGYMLKLPSDIRVSYPNGSFDPVIGWTMQKFLLIDTWQKEVTNGFAIPEGYNSQVFKFTAPWIIETPPGWSCLFIHPNGYNDLPFRSFSGIVDTDLLITDINQPFVVKQGWEGVIEAGTPIAQIIPIKRESWQSEIVIGTEKEHLNNQRNTVAKYLMGYYGKYVHQKKSYR
jgi:hypothetical protein